MLGKTHLVGGLIAGALIVPYVTTSSSELFIACAGLGALLPDIDSPNSLFGRKIKPISYLIQSTMGHRGIFHSLFIAAVLFIALQILLPNYALAITIGYLSHLLLDMLTPSGVPLFWPLSFNISLPVVKTGSLVEKIIFYPLTVWCGLLIFNISIF